MLAQTIATATICQAWRGYAQQSKMSRVVASAAARSEKTRARSPQKTGADDDLLAA